MRAYHKVRLLLGSWDNLISDHNLTIKLNYSSENLEYSTVRNVVKFDNSCIVSCIDAHYLNQGEVKYGLIRIDEFVTQLK